MEPASIIPIKEDIYELMLPPGQSRILLPPGLNSLAKESKKGSNKVHEMD